MKQNVDLIFICRIMMKDHMPVHISVKSKAGFGKEKYHAEDEQGRSYGHL